MEKDLLKIIEHFGINNQQRKLQEEVFELNEAIIKEEINFDEYFHIVEEITDVLILLKQFQHYYRINREDIRKTMKNKIKRTLERIESGYYD